jgi:hypothetical protein
MDEIECILANLIYKKYIFAYVQGLRLSHLGALWTHTRLCITPVPASFVSRMPSSRCLHHASKSLILSPTDAFPPLSSVLSK